MDRPASRATHVGFYLVDDGCRELERSRAITTRSAKPSIAGVLRHPNVVFFGGVILVTFVAARRAALSRRAERSRRVAPGAPARADPGERHCDQRDESLDRRVSAAARAAEARLPRRTAYRRSCARPSWCRRCSRAWTRSRKRSSTIEVQYLANREAHLHFAMLSDFTDADVETARCRRSDRRRPPWRRRALNERYAPATDDAFYLFHRPRRWNPAQGVWMGWERKRGKLSEFNHYLPRRRRATRSPPSSAMSSALRDVRYVITLDADTVLPPDAAPLLVGAIAHPLNRAVYDRGARSRRSRATAFCSRASACRCRARNRSRFAAIHSGQPGVDPYTTAVSDVYQDLYGEGSFTGKGIYDVDAFEQATRGRFPENRLLSHDLIEGSYARAGLVTDITRLRRLSDALPDVHAPQASLDSRRLAVAAVADAACAGTGRPEPNRLVSCRDGRSSTTCGAASSRSRSWHFSWRAGGCCRVAVAVDGPCLLAIAAPWILSLLLAALRPRSTNRGARITRRSGATRGAARSRSCSRSRSFRTRRGSRSTRSCARSGGSCVSKRRFSRMANRVAGRAGLRRDAGAWRDHAARDVAGVGSPRS